jgi:hypothetical protein
MKGGAFILAAILGVLIVQPILIGFGAIDVNSSYSKSKTSQSSCCQSKCSKPKPQEDKRDCEGGRCNPLMGCPTGNFYIHNYAYISITSVIIPKQRTALFNDNRISKQLTECWHPPEII